MGRRPVATSTTSASTVDPGASIRTLVAPASNDVGWTSVSSRQRSAARAVKALEISASWSRSSRLERITWVTSTPNDLNTWAISAATKPPPSTSTDDGNASNRMIVSDVWTRGPSASPGMSGTIGRLPAASTIWSPVTVADVPSCRAMSSVL